MRLRLRLMTVGGTVQSSHRYAHKTVVHLSEPRMRLEMPNDWDVPENTAVTAVVYPQPDETALVLALRTPDGERLRDPVGWLMSSILAALSLAYAPTHFPDDLLLTFGVSAVASLACFLTAYEALSIYVARLMLRRAGRAGGA